MPDLAVMNRLVAAIRDVPLPPGGASIPDGPAKAFNVDCIKRGKLLESVLCPSCTGRVELKVYACDKHKRCCIGKTPDGATTSCSTCADRRTDWPKRFDQINMWPGLPGHRFNPSLVRWKDQNVLTWRNGWKGSEIYIGVLDEEFNPIGTAVKLDLNHPEANYGREDSRLFTHQGKLHVVYAGVMGGSRILHTNVLYARLDDNFKVEEIVYPHIEDRNIWEKNHAYFSHEGEMYAVYSIRPHRILWVTQGKGEWRYETDFPIPWVGGEWRGGASPVRVGGEYWHFCHDRIHINGMSTYRTLLYAFEAKPPFRPTRYAPTPLITADNATRPEGQYCACVFTCGAVRIGDDWILSSGEHDRTSRLDKFQHSELDGPMVRI